METTEQEIVPVKVEKTKKAEKVATVETVSALFPLSQALSESKAAAPLAALEGGGWQKISSTEDSHTSAYEIENVGCLVEVTRGSDSSLVFVPSAKIGTRNGGKYLRS